MKWAVQIFIVSALCLVIKSLDDPYKVLGIHRSSSVPEIRKAYKQLAKEWHPDKNDDPAAADKFVEITQAYELLSDPERRRLFDTFGRVEESRPRPEPQYRQYDPFDDIFAGSGFRFRFSDRDITLFHKLSITSRAYENILVPKSYRTPHLLLFYSDWCFPCLQVEPVWKRIMEELEPIGVGIATVHAENEKGLARKVGVPSLPCLILLSDGRSSVYKESLFSIQKVVEFVRNKMPYKMVPQINDENVDVFLSGWVDNKVRALVFQRSDPLRLRYLLTAFYHRDRVAFGYVPLGPNMLKVREKYQVSSEQDALLVFNEITERPVASVSMADIPVHTMHDVINNNNYLLLPRLSSQALLDALCPAGMSSTRKRLCVVLVCQDTPSHDPHRQSLRRFALESHYSKERVRFMYIYQERQPQFISALTSGKNSPDEPLLHVAILCRRDSSHVKYEWISSQETWESYNNTKQHLESAIDRVLHTTQQSLLNEAVIGELIDEHTQGIMSKLLTRFLQTIDALQESLGKEHILPALSVLATIMIIIGAGYCMNYLMKLEEARVQGECGGMTNGIKTNGYQPQLKIHEMRAETYNGLVRLLRPGCRTILLLVDSQSKPKLVPKFHSHVWPYRKNKTLMFAILNLERGLSWYTEILSQSLPEPRDLSINPKNCIGTVLALNGLRKYFCIYHAKHPEGSYWGKSRMKRIMNNQLGVKTSGGFIGFDDTTSESDLSDVEQGLHPEPPSKYGDVLFVENLLDGLPNWLDRLFEGTTHRYYLNYWPDFGAK
ncbi:dnaJ homolog subfamily C member 16 isoform X1 [Cimex lectularius]|uniref:DnaJ homolog subfamily C member 16 n=1 Tax=Cimex lectularius TaxID=79782 RepID=A0A8I6S1X7_CIMLE|nr:dnaJ homolog subfamily C member 16 isoform X1 [Cimex lectularius]